MDSLIANDLETSLASTTTVGHSKFIVSQSLGENWLDHDDPNVWGGSGSNWTVGTFASLGSPAAMRGPYSP